MADNLRLDLDEYLPYLVNRVGAAMVASFSAEALAAHDLSIAMWRVLVALSSNGEQRQIDLSAMTSIDVSTLSRLVARLVRRGLVSRARSKTSNREVVVELTARGRTLVNNLIPMAKALEQTAIAGIPAKELAALKASLRRAFANVTKAR